MLGADRRKKESLLTGRRNHLKSTMPHHNLASLKAQQPMSEYPEGFARGGFPLDLGFDYDR